MSDGPPASKRQRMDSPAHENPYVNKDVEATISVLSEEDSIMEPDIMTKIKEFFTHYLQEGKTSAKAAEKAVSLLVESYRGNAAMVNLLCDWLDILDGSLDEAHSQTRACLRQLVLENFDCRKADSVFTKERSDPPEWFQNLLQEKESRDLLVQLGKRSEARNSLFIGFALKLIGEHGEGDESATIASVSTASFQGFVGLFANRLADLRCFTNGQLLDKSHPGRKEFDEFSQACASSEHTFTLSLLLINRLVALGKDKPEFQEGATRFRRVSQELLLAVAGKPYASFAYRLALLLSGLERSPAIVDPLVRVCEGESSSTDLAAIRQAVQDDRTLLGDMCCLPILIEYLLDAVFDSTKVKEGIGRNEAAREDSILLLSMVYGWGIKEIDSGSNVDGDEDAVRLSLNKLSDVVLRNPVGATLPSHVAVLLECAKTAPLVAAAVVRFAASNLMNARFYATTPKVSAKILIAVLSQVCEECAPSRPRVMHILSHCFKMDLEVDALQVFELKKLFIDAMLRLCASGDDTCAIGVVRGFATSCNGLSADASLIRYFVVNLLMLANPPYSQPFVSAVMDILCDSHAVSALRSASSRGVVAKFIESLKASGTPITAEQETILSPILHK
eukprot:Rmarinus@m.19408